MENQTKIQKAQNDFADKTPAQIVQDDKVRAKFVAVYQNLHGKDGERFYQNEVFHFMRQLSEKAEVAACDKFSLYGCFMDAAVNDLSFDPGMKQAYLVPFNVNIGTKENPQWQKRCSLLVSAYGELQMRIRSGQIKHADNPVLVYEGDTFSMGTRNGNLYVDHQAKFPRTSEKIIACYVRLERADGSIDYKVLSDSEIQKLRSMSKQPNSPAWTSGLPGMIQTKTLKHAFRSYPRLRVRGQFSKVEDDENGTVDIDYSLENNGQAIPQTASAPAGKITPNPAVNGNGQPSQAAKVAAAAMTADDMGEGHKVDDDSDLFN